MNLDVARRIRRVGRTVRNFSWPQWAVIGVVLAVITLVLWIGVDKLQTRAQDAATQAKDAAGNATDARLTKEAETLHGDADAHRANANAAAVDRQRAEGHANNADAQRAQANANTRRLDERDRGVREAYEKSRNTNAADLPALSDDELCAEFKRRGRPCPAN